MFVVFQLPPLLLCWRCGAPWYSAEGARIVVANWFPFNLIFTDFLLRFWMTFFFFCVCNYTISFAFLLICIYLFLVCRLCLFIYYFYVRFYFIFLIVLLLRIPPSWPAVFVLIIVRFHCLLFMLPLLLSN